MLPLTGSIIEKKLVQYDDDDVTADDEDGVGAEIKGGQDPAAATSPAIQSRTLAQCTLYWILVEYNAHSLSHF